MTTIVDKFIEQINPLPKELIEEEEKQELLLYLSNSEYLSIKNKIVDGHYKNLKVMHQITTPKGKMWVAAKN